MAKNFHETFAHDDVPLPPDRSTGLVFTVVALVIAYFWRANSTVLTSALIVAGALFAVSLLAQHNLRPLNIAWMKFAVLLNKIMSPIIMFVLFLIAIVPFGLAMQLRRDPLQLKRRPDAKSYWIERDQKAKSAMSNQF